jgi:glycerol-3-phosphate acyltransferase PlsY
MEIAIAVCLAYLIGSLPFAYLYGKFVLKTDIRKIGSKNQGATNIFRAGGFKAGAVVFALDFLKGVIALFVANYVFNLDGKYLIFPAVSVVLGHIFSILTKFKGGKGVSTAAGTICVLNFTTFLTVFISFWVLFFVTKTVSKSSLFSALVFLLTSILMYFIQKTEFYFVIYSFVITLILVFSHRENIKRIVNGKEGKTV